MANEKLVPQNPLIMPTAEQKAEAAGGRGACPKCRKSDYGGRKVGGVITFTCRVCSNIWTGGLGREPLDSSRPLPPQNPMERPSVVQTIDKNGVIHETRHAVSLTQEFRKGALVPAPGEEDV